MKNAFINLLVIAILLLGATVFSKGAWNLAQAQKEISKGYDKQQTLRRYGFTTDNPGITGLLISAIKY